MNSGTRSPGPFSLFRGTPVWVGVAMALAGYLAEEFIGGEHAFEALTFFGGLTLGMGLMQNRYAESLRQASKPRQNDNPADRR